MKKIFLSGIKGKNKFVLVDDDDFKRLSKFKWNLVCGRPDNCYAARSLYFGGGRKKRKYKLILMHKQIIDTPKGMNADHINRNTLDNRKENLRVSTYSQNKINQKMRRDNSSGYRVVYFTKENLNKCWRAVITKERKVINIGSFSTKIEAAIAYNEFAIKYHGKFAQLNKV